ncbi:hypothetical protein LCGC14_0781840 [marine sediment metagenome]|uniref:Uncharacterized protein n=1 Tax=marine sediment metagenome TaxID=412755 RepID=A0A0F9QF46_9ZZZZ
MRELAEIEAVREQARGILGTLIAAAPTTNTDSLLHSHTALALIENLVRSAEKGARKRFAPPAWYQMCFYTIVAIALAVWIARTMWAFVGDSIL